MSILMLPFRAVWWLISFAFSLTGRLIGVILGGLLMAIGLALTATILLAIIGIPLVIMGLLLIIKSLLG
ncbi:MAG: hypothetical protein LBE55_07375 [Clostridiales bacterium]|jgi:hypothetical protein|nr:hypothetical protein [Clostridiales bacterium]